MKRYYALIVLFLLLTGTAFAQGAAFDTHFTDATLRLDYVFCGDASRQEIYLRQMLRTSAWAGRRHHLEQPLLRGNGQIRVLDPATGACLYANSFSSLFQEWTGTEEAVRVPRAFENSFQLPWPKHPVNVEVTLWDTHGRVSAHICHPVNPEDILIRPLADTGLPVQLVHGGAPSAEAIDIVIVSEGYAADDEEKFFHDARRAADALFSHEPFQGRAGDFTVRAVFAPSADSGVSIPHEGAWRNTLVSSHFDTFYTERYLTTPAIWQVWDIIGTLPCEQVIVLVNTPVYGGGGIYNNITIMNSDHPTFVPVLVHEFGHAFGGLGDEYFSDDMFETPYPADTEPWEPNLTTLVAFDSKWADLLPAGTPVPTPVDALEKQDVRRIWHTLSPEDKAVLNRKPGVFEGGGYMSHGVYRPVQECRMKINECEQFCPVCERAILQTIDYYTD